MVQFKSLINEESNKKIIATIQSPTGPINIFEPTASDVAAIMNMHELVDYFNRENDLKDKEDTEIPITGIRVVRELYPLLTDITDFDDLSDEEIQQVIDNPTEALMTVNAYVNRVIYRTYTLMILTYMSNLQLQHMENLVADVNEKTLDMIVESASKTDEGREALENLKKSTDALQEQQREINEKDVLEDEKLAKENSEASSNKVIQMSYKERLENQIKGKFEDVDQ